jgi:hypothetical protein
MAARKPPKRLFKHPELRQEPPLYLAGGSATKRMKRMSNDYPDVLQNIEFALVSSFQDDSNVDDRIVDMALSAALKGEAPEDPRAAAVYDELVQTREMREDVPEEVWRECLRVVQDSAHTHSGCKPGETRYLRFAQQFML